MRKKGSARPLSGRRDFSAVTDAFVEHGDYLKTFLYRFLKRPQDIEDIAQEAYIRAFQTEQENSVEHPKTLLFTIAKNLALNELRSKARRIIDYIDECHAFPVNETATTEEEVEAQDRLKIYCAAVDALPEQCRRVYLLRKVHGLPQQEIADRLHISVRTVERHLQKGVISCKRYMDERAGEVGDKDWKKVTHALKSQDPREGKQEDGHNHG